MSASSSVDKAAKHSVLLISFLSMPSKYVHLLAATCTYLNTPSISEPVEHEGPSLEWLSSTAKCVVERYVVPKESEDPIYACSLSSLYVSFLYTGLKRLIRYDKGAWGTHNQAWALGNPISWHQLQELLR